MDLFELNGRVVVNLADALKAFDEIQKEGQKTESKLGKFFSGIGKGAAVVGKAVGVGMLAAGTAVAGLVGKATSAYAEYEQLVGGVETLFKDSAGKVKEYAEKAYETAGMSANEYMNTVTSFSASLLQSLGGDTEKAADKADVAIRDMSDNANKMGTSMESIQNAYQGFAKQNYTMLDNLKLGYGGTKEEMQRLLDDAEKLSGQEFDISSYADIVDAIHVVQTEMGITGTTASEAAGTISGSMASVKGAWQNLVTAMASDDLPLDEYIDKFVDSAVTMASNMLPRIEKALGGVVQLIDKLAPVIIGKIPELLSQLLPSIIQAAVGLVNSIVTILPDLVNMLVTDVIPQLLTGFTLIINALIGALPTLIETLAASLPTLIPMLIDALVSVIVTLCNNFGAIIQPIIDYLPDIIMSIVDAVLDNLPIVIQGLITFTMAVVKAIPQILGALKEAYARYFATIWEAIQKVFSNIGGWFKDKFTDAWNKIKSVFSGVKKFFTDLWGDIKDAFTELGGKVADTISEPVKKAINNVIGGAEKIINGFFGLINGAITEINKIPGVNISKIKLVEFARLARGGVVDEPTPAIFGEDGAEAVVPLENNTEWLDNIALRLHGLMSQRGGISTVSVELQKAQVSELQILNGTVSKILAAILMMDENMGGHLREALDGMSLSGWNKREFARLVREVN